MKKGISLIVLVITIIVMIILAASVVLTLSNTGIIDRADQAAQLTNKNQLQTSIDLMLGDMMLANNGQKPNSFELVEELYSNNIITDSQKTEMLTSGGELKIGEETLRLDTTSIIDTYWIETVKEDTAWKLRFQGILNKVDDLEYTEFGTMFLPKSILDRYNPEENALDKFTIANSEALTTVVIKSEKYTEKDNRYEWVAALNQIPDSMKEKKICVRAYAKYTYNGVEGIIYSNIQEIIIASTISE